MKKIISLIIFIYIFNVSYSQVQVIENSGPLSCGQKKKIARNAEKIGDIYTAIDYYTAYLECNSNDIEATYSLAKLLERSRDYQKAEQYYKQVYDSNNKQYLQALFSYALMQKMNCKPNEALAIFKKFQKECNDNTLKKIVDNEIDGCNLAIKLEKNKKDIKITHLDTSINRGYIEFSPVFESDTSMIYASYKTDSVIYYSTDSIKKNIIRKFYYAKRRNDKWVGTGVLNRPFNHPEKHTGNGAFSPNGTRFYFTRCQSNYQNKIICNLYVSKLDMGEWKEPVALPCNINQANYTYTQPSVGVDLKTGEEIIYFVSDMHGGEGGLDIWFTTYNADKDTYSPPQNAGRKINTAQDEMTPYYDFESHILYFSSNGLPSIGGFDIFKSTGEKTKWSKPENIGYPYNSCVDDIYFVINPNKKQEGFLVSNRIGGNALKNPTCCDDIYYHINTEVLTRDFVGLIYEIKDNQDKITTAYINQHLLDDATITIYMKVEKEGVATELKSDVFLTPDKDPNLIIQNTLVSDQGGKYICKLDKDKEYKFVVSKDGYFTKHVDYSTKNLATSGTIEIPPIGLMLIPKKAIVIPNIYYPYGKSFLTDDAKKTIDSMLLKVLRESPDLIVEISSHTDSVSGFDFNMRLSQARAQSVVDYLIEKGIDRNRLVAKGYGETKPIAPNTNPDGTDNVVGRALNRRTEFKVIGSKDMYSKLNIQNDIKVIKKTEEKKK